MLLYISAYWQYYLMGIILIPGIIFASIASARVNSNYNKFKNVFASSEITGAEAVKRILFHAGVTGVNVYKTNSGDELNNYYNPKNNSIYLSPAVFDGTDISSIGIAGHEAGHAIQYARNYTPVKIRKVFGVLSNISAKFLWPLVAIGLVFNFAYANGLVGDIFMFSGVAFFGLSVIFSLVTLPVEYNASNRALKNLVSSNCLTQMEVKGAQKVLSSAALTYVAALVTSILSLLRFLLVILKFRDRD